MKNIKYWFTLFLLSFSFAYGKTSISETSSSLSIIVYSPNFQTKVISDTTFYDFSNEKFSSSQYSCSPKIKSNYFSFRFSNNKEFDRNNIQIKSNYKSIKNKNIILINDLINCSISFLGIRRGVPVYVMNLSPIILKKGEIYSLDSANITIKYDIPLVDKPNQAPDPAFFGDILNPKMTTQLLNNILNDIDISSKKNSNPTTLSADKFIYKIETQKDGIAKFDLSDLLSQSGEFSGKPISNFNLKHKDKSVPVYYKDNGDGVISSDDKIYFVGSRATADTTWFNHYTNKEAYIIEINTGNNPRISKQPSLNVTNKLSSVQINKHIERDSSYFEGKTSTHFPEEGYLDVGPAEFEGWYWAQLPRIQNPDDTAKFRFNFSKLFICPSVNPNDSLKIAVNYSTLNYRRDRTDNPYKIEFKLNGESVYNDEFNRLETAFVGRNFAGSELVGGFNVVDMYNYYMDLSNPFGDKRDWLGIDYIALTGKVSPFAYNGELTFTKEPTTSPSWVQISGFSSKNILAYSSKDSTLAELTGLKGVSFAIGAKKGKENYLTGVVDSKEKIQKTNGASLVVVTPDGSNQLFSTETPAIFINEMNKAVTGSIIILFSNKDYFLNTELKNLLTQLGSKIATTADPASPWAFACKKGDLSSISEVFNVNTLSLSGFFPSDYGSSFQADVSLISDSSNITVMDENGIEKANLVKDKFYDLKNISDEAECLYIYRKDFEATVNRLAEYRKNQNYKIKTIEVSSIYDEFNFGKKSETAIKDFLAFAYHNWNKTKLKYVVLFGDASMDCRGIIPKSREDIVPTVGFPSTDYFYGLIDGDEYDLEPELIVARIPGPTPEAINNYIDKLVDMESIPNKPWMKNFLLLNGGGNLDEIGYLNTYSKQLAYRLTRPNFILDTLTICKENTSSTSETQGLSIRKAINKGAVWTNFMGHAAAEIFDLDGWQVDLLNNDNKFGVLSAVSCNSCAYTEPVVQCRGESYITAKNKGFVTVIGSSSVGFAESGYIMIDNMFKAIADTTINLRRVGDLLTYSKNQMHGVPTYPRDAANLMKTYVVLFGDPMMKIRIPEKTDYYFNDEEFTTIGSDKSPIINSETEYVTLSGVAYNASYACDSAITIELTQRHGSFVNVQNIETTGFARSFPFSFQVPVKNMEGAHELSIKLNSHGAPESNYLNNEYTNSIYVYSTSLSPLEPLNFMNVNYKTPQFRQISPYSDSTDYEYTFLLYKNSINDSNVIKKSLVSEIVINENYIDWKPQIELSIGTKYLLESYITIKSKGTRSSSSIIHFTAGTEEIKGNAKSAIIGSDLMYCQTDSMDLKNTEYLQISSTPVDVKVVSVKGEAGDHNQRWAFVQFGDKIYFNNYFPIGVKLVTVDKNNYKNGVVREYNVFGDNESIKSMINFLRDTLQNDKYLAIAHSDVFMPSDHGYYKYIDTLKSVLKSYYGAKLADSIAFYKSYAYFGVKGAKLGEVYEDVNTVDSAKISTIINFYKDSGFVESTVFGPAQKWGELKLQTKDFSNNDYRIIGTGYNSAKTSSKLLFDTSAVSNLDLSNISTNDFPYIKFNFIFKGGYSNSKSKFYGLNIDFIPTPELAVSQKSIRLTDSTLLQCDTNFISYTIKNLSLRVNADFFASDMFVNSTFGYFSNSKNITGLQPNSQLTISEPIETKSLAGLSNTSIQLSFVTPITELYKFNNTGTTIFSVYEDTIKPTIKVYFDGKLIKSGDMISNHPKIEVFVYDNSLKEITESRGISAWLNGAYIQESNVDEFDYKTFGFSRPLKSTLSFYPDTLTMRDVSFRLKYLDGTKNEAAVTYILQVPTEARVDSLLVYPNPTSDKVNLKFNFSSPIKSGNLYLNIFDISGRKVRQIKKEILLGENNISFETIDSIGSRLAQGMYYFVITIEDNIYLEPKRGKFCIIY